MDIKQKNTRFSFREKFSLTKKSHPKIWLSILAVFFASLFLLLGIGYIHAQESISNRLKGRILLQVEQKGESWYVNPVDKKRHFMGRPNDAFNLMRDTGMGITNEDLKKISIAEANMEGEDADGDGLSGAFEDAVGTDKNNVDTDKDGYNDKAEIISGHNPNGQGKINTDNSFANKHKGKIFIQVEAHGEAWYVNPVNKKRYFLFRPSDAFNVMRGLGLGITDNDLNKIEKGEYKEKLPDVPYTFYNVHIHPENANDRGFVILENLINLADSYNTKLTLGFHIQFIDMILADPVKTEKVRQWQENGHEIAIEHHSATHGGWDGYSNLPEDIAIKVYKTFFPGSPIIYPYSGTFDEAYVRFNQLAYLNTVKSGVTALKSEMPIGHIYDIDSLKVVPWADGRTSKVVVNMFNNHLTYRINARSGYLDDDWKTNVEECDKATSDEVCGFIAHLSDYAEDDFATAKEVWSYYYEKDPEGEKRKTVSWIMENYIIPNDLIIHERCGNTICDDEEFETDSCPSDCKACNKIRFGDYWINIHEGNTFNCDVGNSSQIYLMGRTEVCGDSICNKYQGENKDSCPDDCGGNR